MKPSQKILVPVLLALCLNFCVPAIGQVDTSLIKTHNRMLVCSGGGARGAWGVGLVNALFNRDPHYGYDAVIGTSTGSLMAPYILLASTDRHYLDSLRIIYTSVSQKKIFNVNPFCISYNKNTGVVSAQPNVAVIIARILFKTLGTSYRLRGMIHKNFTNRHLDAIINAHQYLGVAVTDMATGDNEVVSSNQVGHDACTMGDWIWASANEPLWMSYYQGTSPNTGKTDLFVDGGLRDVIPIARGLKFAVDNEISNVDVIINNGRQVIDTMNGDDQKKMKAIKGLERILEIYNAGTAGKDTLIGRLMAELYKCQTVGGCDSCNIILEAERSQTISQGVLLPPGRDFTITVNIYFMDNDLAALYRAELAFFPQPMKILYDAGLNYFGNHVAMTYHISSHRFQNVFKKLYVR